MKVIRAGYQLINDKEFDSPLQKVERIARICYKSEDKITRDSYKRMAEMLMKKQHLAMFEHANLVFEVDGDIFRAVELVDNIITTSVGMNNEEISNLCRIHRTRTQTGVSEERYVISANIRAFYEFFTQAVKYNVHNGAIASLYAEVNNRIDNMFTITELQRMGRQGWCKLITDFTGLTTQERLIHETFTVVFTCDRGVTHELVRMRDASFAQESTRYCNYQLGKFGKEITVIKPCFFADENSVGYLKWKDACEYAEKMYFMLLDGGATPQEARSVLPTSVKADIAVTANLYEWRHIFNLRACDATGPAHPQMKEIMVPLFEEMCEVYPSIIGILKK